MDRCGEEGALGESAEPGERAAAAAAAADAEAAASASGDVLSFLLTERDVSLAISSSSSTSNQHGQRGGRQHHRQMN